MLVSVARSIKAVNSQFGYSIARVGNTDWFCTRIFWCIYTTAIRLCDRNSNGGQISSVINFSYFLEVKILKLIRRKLLENLNFGMWKNFNICRQLEVWTQSNSNFQTLQISAKHFFWKVGNTVTIQAFWIPAHFMLEH